jgi:hypothetical protein
MRRQRPIITLLAALALLMSISVTSVSATEVRSRLFLLTLTGDQEATPTCAPPALCGDPDAVAGMALVVLPARDKVCFATAWKRIDGTVTAAHIHLAPVGVPGPVKVPLFAGSFDGTDSTYACMPALGFAGAILANPSAYYVNIHSTVYPAGAVRAQLG